MLQREHSPILMLSRASIDQPCSVPWVRFIFAVCGTVCADEFRLTYEYLVLMLWHFRKPAAKSDSESCYWQPSGWVRPYVPKNKNLLTLTFYRSLQFVFSECSDFVNMFLGRWDPGFERKQYKKITPPVQQFCKMPLTYASNPWWQADVNQTLCKRALSMELQSKTEQ